MNTLKEMPNNICDYDKEIFESNSQNNEQAQMSNFERDLLRGTIRYFKPKRILEVGVAHGGGTVVILNSIEDMPDTTLTSIDIMTKCWNDNTKDVAHVALKEFPDNKNWELYTGKDPSQIIEDVAKNGKFDFLILDTVHTHPIESINFLTVLPFLTENAVMVLHDIMLGINYVNKKPNYLSNFPQNAFACKLLFDTVVGDKFTIPFSEFSKYEKNISDEMYFPNIGVVQLNSDTRKYMYNIFSMLFFPWGLGVERIEHIGKIIEKYYEDEYFYMFKKAYIQNMTLISKKFQSYDKSYTVNQNIINSNNLVNFVKHMEQHIISLEKRISALEKNM